MERGGYTSPLAEQLAPELLERFERYVRIDTQSSRDGERSPSTPSQLELGRLLVAELQGAGLDDAEIDANGYVTATLPADGAGGAPPDRLAIGLIAHLDTMPDAPGGRVEPLVHRAYDGATIALPRGGTVLDPAAMPELASKVGHDIVTASGDTLLGADDKAGVAAIMAAVAHLAAHPELPRITLKICFTPDEEIGALAGRLDLERFGAACAYTIDGGELGELQDETFSALEALITIHGVDVHPGEATGKMVNAIRFAARLVASLPAALSPEATRDREGFIHPYQLSGTPAAARIRVIIRDFDEDLLAAHMDLLRQSAEKVVSAEPRARLELEVHRQYTNMRRFVERMPEVVAAAEDALRMEGIEPIRRPIRGGTDGSRLSERGLPTPNIFTGSHDHHSVREWGSLQDMSAAAATIVRLAEVWTQPQYAQAVRVRQPVDSRP